MDSYCNHSPTLYSEGRTIYHQTPTLYDPSDNWPQPRPQPAAPAASVEPDPPPPPVTPPSTPKVWRRQHGHATRTAPGSSSTMPVAYRSRGRDDDNDVQVGHVVYQSLQRPKLLRGGEWQLSLATNLIAAGFVLLTIMQWNWRFLPGALLFGGPIQWLLRVMADHDPKRWQKYLRTIGQPLIREAHGKPSDSAPAPRILPKPSLLIH